jgi:hypothetical protein
LNDPVPQHCHGDSALQEDCTEDGDGNSEHEDTGLRFVYGSSEAARVIEMAYLSEEPGLLEVIRAVACLPPETRTALLAFLSTASDARRISAVTSQGDLILSSL